MKKILMIVVIILILCGCNSNTKDSKDDWTISIYVDSDTCVEYLKYQAGYRGGLSVRYSKDSVVKINMECLESKGK